MSQRGPSIQRMAPANFGETAETAIQRHPLASSRQHKPVKISQWFRPRRKGVHLRAGAQIINERQRLDQGSGCAENFRMFH